MCTCEFFKKFTRANQFKIELETVSLPIQMASTDSINALLFFCSGHWESIINSYPSEWTTETWNLGRVMAMTSRVSEWIETNLQQVNFSLTTQLIGQNLRQWIQVQKHFQINRLGYNMRTFWPFLSIYLIYMAVDVQYLNVPEIYPVMCWRSRSESSRRLIFHPILPLCSCYFLACFINRTKEMHRTKHGQSCFVFFFVFCFFVFW